MSSEYDKKNEPGQTEPDRDKSARQGQNPQGEEQKDWREGQGGSSSQKPGKSSESESE